MIIVTGGAGFIGSNIVAGLNRRGITDILVVDNLKNGVKFLNLRDLDFADFLDKFEFRRRLAAGHYRQGDFTAVFHQGACSDTMEYDGAYMMDNNYTYSQELLHFCLEQRIPFLYASSAATYGDATRFVEHRDNERPLNVYGYSKLLFDRYAARFFSREAQSTVVGLRYFNVYGPREQHKGRMASQAFQLRNQIRERGWCQLFSASHGCGDGGHLRDFVWVEDAVAINLHFALDSAPVRTVCNVGTGVARSFRDVAMAVIAALGEGELRFAPMPEVLRDKYQAFTQADITRLRAAGYRQPFTALEQGVNSYMAWLDNR
ncbi:MAG: ADP-glyceromanno-heptose 6-epimerase [Magnetococcus sp. WYHC-3]